MASDRPAAPRVLFSNATKVEKLDSHTYKVNLDEAFCIGKVPNGGYTSSCMLAAASAHLSSRDQPDTLTAHFEYPNRTSAGPAVVVIEDVKLGKQVSTLHLTLWQGGLLDKAPWITPSVSRRTVLAYANHINLRTFEGLSLPTGYEGTEAAELPPVPEFELLKKNGADDTWEEQKLPKAAAVQGSLRNWRFFLPRKGPLAPGVLDMWISLASGEPITQTTLPYVADSFPFNLHTFLAAPELRALLEAPPADKEEDTKTKDARTDVAKKNEERAALWFPTVVMNLDMKSALPEEGVEWLAVRVTSKQIKDGKFDLDVLIRDEDGDIIALSHHVAMILSIERNTGKKSSVPKASL
ncbi:Thioesterase-like protein TwmA [Cladobotryum mycophilum]|uniref:Thioesterase-like protein TwmA n=1 Tax=Cladobotryum mycophilum TaxID=491253 RepID=A0ABR0SKP2_9HYPO